jgi:ribosome-associated protein
MSQRPRAGQFSLPAHPGTTLGQFLKIAGIASTGGEAKLLIARGGVVLNGETEYRRGRKLKDGDVVEAAGRAVRIEETTSERAAEEPPSEG